MGMGMGAGPKAGGGGAAGFSSAAAGAAGAGGGAFLPSAAGGAGRAGGKDLRDALIDTARIAPGLHARAFPTPRNLVAVRRAPLTRHALKVFHRAARSPHRAPHRAHCQR
jgi:hypothetical protein